jgi:hypothetical protein
VLLTWEAPDVSDRHDAATSYEVRLSTVTDEQSAEVTETSAVFEGLPPATNFRVEVIPWNEAGSGASASHAVDTRHDGDENDDDKDNGNGHSSCTEEQQSAGESDVDDSEAKRLGGKALDPEAPRATIEESLAVAPTAPAHNAPEAADPIVATDMTELSESDRAAVQTRFSMWLRLVFVKALSTC